ncbi:tautomerase family protein [uncultured Alteromonas sp.]|jgi:phenylpyruvate tautomerase PptA (4-oxalocrotonate tautomerase family)|uniref:tautomerase family protein n=1 Tax=uncultured Alteromonas sp. TaxID=179113 RepID=UPI0025FFC61C|nr:tautomerase family protein [uncultured Alteromonas sp.]
MVVIYGINKHLNPIKRELSDAIHGCMQSVLGMPEGKRAHRFVPLTESDFFYPEGRTEAYTVIEINMMSGRTPATQKAMIKALFTTISSTLGISPVDIEITIKEQEKYQWGFRGMTGDEAIDLQYKVDI